MHRTLALAACLLASFAAEAVSNTAQSALLGLQPSAKHRDADDGRSRELVMRCQAVKPARPD